MRVSGWPKDTDFNAGDFTGCAVCSDLERTGFLETSDPAVNRLIANALWGQRSNFLDVPTDCPQRDERLGWTGDAMVFAPTACYNMDSRAFYAKYLHDLRVGQEELEGLFRTSFLWPETGPAGAACGETAQYLSLWIFTIFTAINISLKMLIQ